MYPQFSGMFTEARLCLLTVLYLPLLDRLSASVVLVWYSHWSIFSILFCKEEKFYVCSPCTWLGGWLQRRKTLNICMLKNHDSSLLLFSDSLRWVVLYNSVRSNSKSSISARGGTTLAPCWLLAVIQVARVSLCYAGLSCQYANLPLWAASVTCSITLFHMSFILIRGWFSEKGGACWRSSGSHSR